MEKVLSNPAYRPDQLLDALRTKLELVSDGALARKIDITRTLISKIRNKRVEVSAGMWITLSELSGLSVGQLRELAGLPRRMYIAA